MLGTPNRDKQHTTLHKYSSDPSKTTAYGFRKQTSADRKIHAYVSKINPSHINESLPRSTKLAGRYKRRSALRRKASRAWAFLVNSASLACDTFGTFSDEPSDPEDWSPHANQDFVFCCLTGGFPFRDALGFFLPPPPSLTEPDGACFVSVLCVPPSMGSFSGDAPAG